MLFNGLFLPPPSLASPSAELISSVTPKCNAALLIPVNKEVRGPPLSVEVGLLLDTFPVEVLLVLLNGGVVIVLLLLLLELEQELLLGLVPLT